MRNEISTELFKLLNKGCIKYAVLRNYKTLPENLGGSDIDMWVNAANLEKCYDCLKNAAQATHAALVTTYGDSTAVKIGIQNQENGVQIDIFKGNIYYKNKILISGDIVAKHITQYNGISVMDDDFADLLAFLKELLNNGRVGDKYLNPIYKKKVYTKEYIDNALPNFAKTFKEDLIDCISRHIIERKARALRTSAIHCLSKADSVSSFKQGLSRFKRMIGKRPGYVIVVEGTDGSGKSFIINSVTPWLEEAFHHGVIYNHLRPNLIPDIAMLLGKRELPKIGHPSTVVTNPHSKKPSGFLVSLFRFCYYITDYTFGYLLKVWPAIHSKSKVFIFDRYYYEYYLDQRRSRTNLPQCIIRLGECFIAKPDLILCLGGDPQKIYTRKPETSFEEVSCQVDVLRNFCSNRDNAIWIETTVTPEESINAARLAITTKMSQRFSIEELK